MTTNPIQGILYAEFDNHEGPVIRKAFPDGCLSQEFRDFLREYIIYEKHLCNQVITVGMGKEYFSVICVTIENAKYERNAFTFSFGLLLSPDKRHHREYHILLRNVTTFFHDLELECEFLSRASTKEILFEVLQLIYDSFVSAQSTFIAIENPNWTPITADSKLLTSSPSVRHFYLTLQMFEKFNFFPEIQDYDVPMFTCDKIQMSQLIYDISFRHIIFYIDGYSHVKKIAKEVHMDLLFVKKTLSLLLFYNLIIMGDCFKYKNIYDYQSRSVPNTLGLSRPHPLLEHSRYSQRELEMMHPLLLDDTCMKEIVAFAQLEALPATSATSTNTTNNINTNPTATTVGLGHDGSSGITGSIEMETLYDQIRSFLKKFTRRRTVGDILMEVLDNVMNHPEGDEEDSHGNNHTNSNSSIVTTPIEIDDSSNSPPPPPQLSGSTTNRVSILNSVSIPRLIAICVAKGILRRVREYPWYTKTVQHSLHSPESGESTSSLLGEGLSPLNTSHPHLSDLHLLHPSLTSRTSGKRLGHMNNTNNHPSTPAHHEPRFSFTKINASHRGKSIISQNYLRGHIDLQEILEKLDGSEHLDAICCRYDLWEKDILEADRIVILYR